MILGRLIALRPWLYKFEVRMATVFLRVFYLIS